jgi:hypothetical protein
MNEKLRNFLVFEQAWKPISEARRDWLITHLVVDFLLIGLPWGIIFMLAFFSIFSRNDLL